MHVLDWQTLALSRGQLGCYSSGTIHFAFWSRVAHWNLSKLGWPASPRTTPVSTFIALGLHMSTAIFGFTFFFLGYIYLFIYFSLCRYMAAQATAQTWKPEDNLQESTSSYLVHPRIQTRVTSFTKRYLISQASFYEV